MSDTGKIPQSMIDAGRDEWHNHDARVIDDGDYGWIWMCECSATGAGDSEDDCTEDADRHEFGAALAAAFAECEVRQEIEVQTPGLRYPCGDMAAAWRQFGELKAGGYDAQIVTRTAYRTPPVVVTPNEGDQQ